METGWTVGAVVAAVSVAGGESVPFCFAGVGGCIDSFPTPTSLGCGVVVAAAAWFLSVTTVVSLTNVTVVNDVTGEGSVDTEVAAWLTSCAHTLSRTPKDEHKYKYLGEWTVKLTF